MSQAKPDLILVCAADLELHVSSRTRVEITLDDETIRGGSHSLAILHVFRQPTSVRDAVERLKTLVSGTQDWIDMLNGIANFYAKGVLVEPARIKPAVSENWARFDGAFSHISMLNDRQRTLAYLDAVREVVRPGDVVVDLGTGTGILAMVAAQAGASRVYALEVGKIADVAQSNFDANHLSDRITLLRGWSTQLSLPEQADVMVSEIIGSEPLAERMIEYTADAVRRFLKPQARLIPARIKLYMQFTSLPDEELGKYVFLDETLEHWQSWYGIDFKALREITTRKPFRSLIKPSKLHDWVKLSEPILMTDIDLAVENKPYTGQTVIVEAQAAGRLDGVLIYPDLDLSPKIVLSRSPEVVDQATSWLTPLWILPQSLPVERGQRFQVIYRYYGADKNYNLEITRI